MEPDSTELFTGMHWRHLRCGRVLPNVAEVVSVNSAQSSPAKGLRVSQSEGDARDEAAINTQGCFLWRKCSGDRIAEPEVVRNVQSRSLCWKTLRSRPLEIDSMQNPKVMIFRLLIWALLMCLASLITADFEPHKVVFIRGLFLVLFVPMVLIPIHHKQQGEQADRAIGKESDV
jgi:hypothetical protein